MAGFLRGLINIDTVGLDGVRLVQSGIFCYCFSYLRSILTVKKLRGKIPSVCLGLP